MPTPRGMNFCIVWKRGMGDGMGEKKYRGRFSIGFNENDPAHLAVIHILERQGTRQKAQFIANAVLHYIHCPETPDIPVPKVIDRTMIESVVLDILKQQNDKIVQVEQSSEQLVKTVSAQITPMDGTEEISVGDMDEDTLRLISSTLEGFREK